MAVRYFTAPVRNDPKSHARQQVYLRALRVHSPVVDVRLAASRTARQQTSTPDDGALRPDLVVRLADGKQVVVATPRWRSSGTWRRWRLLEQEPALRRTPPGRAARPLGADTRASPQRLGGTHAGQASAADPARRAGSHRPLTGMPVGLTG